MVVIITRLPIVMKGRKLSVGDPILVIGEFGVSGIHPHKRLVNRWIKRGLDCVILLFHLKQIASQNLAV